MILKTNYGIGRTPTKIIEDLTINFSDDVREYGGSHVDTTNVFKEFFVWLEKYGLNDIYKSNWYDLCPVLRMLAPDFTHFNRATPEALKYYCLCTMKALPIGTLLLPLKMFKLVTPTNRNLFPKLVSLCIMCFYATASVSQQIQIPFDFFSIFDM